ncbi:MAG: hypothetical protein J6C06_04640 [Lachnospiraceae bacterium]|nr:hypothetical protein [Lachnospiraceae bacterium]
MTGSELQCTNILIDYFFKEFVYRDLYVYAGKQKQELCDGLVEFQDAYVIFQIKEKNGSTAQDWLQKKVYKKAVSQIKDTISKIRSGNIIEVESYTGEKVVLENQKQIYPVIIFDSNDSEYKQIHTSSKNNDLRINVFSMDDFRMVLERIAIPYDIVSYIEMRSAFFESTFPDLFINEIDEGLTTLSKIENEEGMIDYFIALVNGNKYIDQNAIEGFKFVIKSFQERLLDGELYNKEEYKQTLKYLLKSNRNTVHDFMLRWQICVEHCMKKEETINHFLIDTGNKVGYLYLTEIPFVENKEFIEFVLRVFKYKFALETVIGVVFNMINEVEYTVEWILLSFEIEHNEQYEKILEEEKLWSNIKQLRLY